MTPVFALGRILGNQLPPRDGSGGRLAALGHLFREPPLACVTKFWLVNRVWDPALVGAYDRLMNGLPDIHELPFEPEPYFEAADRGRRLLYCPGINVARNECLRIAFEEYGARFAAVLDGDCGFVPQQWEEVLANILGDALDGATRDAYSVRSIRVGPSAWYDLLEDPKRAVPGGQDEHQLIMARTAWEAGLRFDETRPFGVNDKVELFRRLGHYRLGHRCEIISEDRCRSVGSCCHIYTGKTSVELTAYLRARTRREALERMHADIVHHYAGDEA